MATDLVTVSPTYNGDSVSLTAGLIVRLAGANNNVVRAQADSAAHVQGVNGIVVSGSSAPGTVCTVACAGRQTVQMEIGLTLAVGDTVYVSASVAGKGTNVIPGVVLPIGSIADLSAYAASKTVEVDVIASSSEAGAGGTFPGYGGAPPAVAAASSAGAAGTASRSDHTHAGVASLNGETGALVVESTGGTVAVTTPDGTHVNLEVTNPLVFAAPGSIGPNEPTAGVASTAMRSDALPGQKIEAQWPIANVRWYAVDGTNGSDANVGFSDTSSADAGTKAKQTLAGLAAIFPLVGASRKVVVIINQGAYSDNLDIFLQGASGYAASYPLIVATGTNATASAVAFAGDANDRLFVGAATATGANASGYNPIGSPTQTTVQLAQVGGGVPALASEPALPLGARLRFDSATATVALRNVSVAIIGVTTTSTANDTLLLPSPATGAGGLAVVPSTSDTCYIEMPGVTVGTCNLTIGGNANGPGGISNQNAPTFVGLNVSVNTRISGGRTFWAFSRHAFFSPINADLTTTLFSYKDESGAARQVGPTRADGASGSTGPTGMNSNNANASFFCAGAFTIANAIAGTLSNGSYVGAGIGLFNVAYGIDSASNQPQGSIGARTVNSQSTIRIVGAITIQAKTAGISMQTSSVTLEKVQITGVGANPAIAMQGQSAISVTSSLIGSSGNSDVGLDLTGAVKSTVLIYSNPTLTGTNGDVRLSDGTIVTWAVAAAGLVDPAGNQLYSPTTAPLGTKVASAATTVALGNVAPATVTSSTPTAWTPLVINGVKYLVPLWPST